MSALAKLLTGQHQEEKAFEALRKMRHASVDKRLSALGQALSWTCEEQSILATSPGLSKELVEQMIENAVGMVGIPLGFANHFWVNGKPYVVPMATEEPSVIAAASLGARIVSRGGGFHVTSMAPLMVAQVQLLDVENSTRAAQRILEEESALTTIADLAQPGMKKRGGGVQRIEVRHRVLKDGRACLVVHLLVDVRDAMGANVLNSMAEAVAPKLEELSQGRAVAKILSNYADERLVKATCAIPFSALTTDASEGAEIARAVEEVSLFAEADVHRAVTHNKGIMNGVDAVALATGNDLRAIEAGAHAFAARSGTYSPLATWRREKGFLLGELELPLQMGIAGASIRASRLTTFLLDRVLNVKSANELAEITAAVGLAQNLSALRALGTEGISRGHMALHNRRLSL